MGPSLPGPAKAEMPPTGTTAPLPSPLESIAVRFSIFLAIFLAIIGIIFASNDLLIAPPYAVTTYLVVFNPSSRYAQPRNIVASYLAVIASSELFEFLLGSTVLALALNVILVAGFISFTPYSHPPAVALAIFSLLIHDPPGFALTSVVVLIIVGAAAVVIPRIAPLRRWLETRPI